MRTCLLALALLLAAVTARNAAAQQTAATDSVEVALIRKLIKASSMGEQLILSMEVAIPAQRASSPEIPAEFWDRFIKRARDRQDDLLEQLIPVYARTFTTPELEALVRFWQSDVGQRFVQVQPQLISEMSQLAEAWGAQLGMEIAQELQAEGILGGQPSSNKP